MGHPSENFETLLIFLHCYFWNTQNRFKYPKIANLEFENHGFLKNHVFLPTKQAGTNIS